MARPTLLKRVHRATTRTYRRARSNPFAHTEDRPLLVHGAHHKAGTVWFGHVLSAVASTYGLRYFAGEQRDLPPRTDVFLQHHSLVRPDELRPCRGSHLIRDPRDLVVSGYYYHLWTDEAWVHLPRSELGGLSYQQHLRSLDEHDGLMAEIDRIAEYAEWSMLTWNYGDPRFLELKYEAFITDPQQGFGKVFRHYGFHDEAVARAVAIADEFSLSRAAQQTKSDGRSHVRSGRPGEWRDVLGDDHVAHFKDATGDLLVRLGYERDANW